MLSGLAAVLVPGLSVLLGALLTYWLNVRGRRRGAVEALFDAAIAAMAVADASQHYLSDVGRPAGMSESGYRALVDGLVRAGVENHARRAAEAREAVARVVSYEPRVRPFYQDSVLAGDRPQEVIALLVEARSRVVGRAVPLPGWWRASGRRPAGAGPGAGGRAA